MKSILQKEKKTFRKLANEAKISPEIQSKVQASFDRKIKEAESGRKPKIELPKKRFKDPAKGF